LYALWRLSWPWAWGRARGGCEGMRLSWGHRAQAARLTRKRCWRSYRLSVGHLRLSKAVGTSQVIRTVGMLRMPWVLRMLGMPRVLRMEPSIGRTSRRWRSAYYGRQPGGRMRFSGNRCPHRAPRLSDSRWGDDCDVGDVRHIRGVSDVRCLLNRHSRSDHWGCAHHHRRRCPNGSWNNDPSARTRRGRNKDPIGT
jgi:hypothetical protein